MKNYFYSKLSVISVLSYNIILILLSYRLFLKNFIYSSDIYTHLILVLSLGIICRAIQIALNFTICGHKNFGEYFFKEFLNSLKVYIIFVIIICILYHYKLHVNTFIDILEVFFYSKLVLVLGEDISYKNTNILYKKSSDNLGDTRGGSERGSSTRGGSSRGRGSSSGSRGGSSGSRGGSSITRGDSSSSTRPRASAPRDGDRRSTQVGINTRDRHGSTISPIRSRISSSVFTDFPIQSRINPDTTTLSVQSNMNPYVSSSHMAQSNVNPHISNPHIIHSNINPHIIQSNINPSISYPAVGNINPQVPITYPVGDNMNPQLPISYPIYINANPQVPTTYPVQGGINPYSQNLFFMQGNINPQYNPYLAQNNINPQVPTTYPIENNINPQVPTTYPVQGGLHGSFVPPVQTGINPYISYIPSIQGVLNPYGTPIASVQNAMNTYDFTPPIAEPTEIRPASTPSPTVEQPPKMRHVVIISGLQESLQPSPGMEIWEQASTPPSLSYDPRFYDQWLEKFMSEKQAILAKHPKTKELKLKENARAAALKYIQAIVRAEDNALYRYRQNLSPKLTPPRVSITTQMWLGHSSSLMDPVPRDYSHTYPTSVNFTVDNKEFTINYSTDSKGYVTHPRSFKEKQSYEAGQSYYAFRRNNT